MNAGETFILHTPIGSAKFRATGHGAIRIDDPGTAEEVEADRQKYLQILRDQGVDLTKPEKTLAERQRLEDEAAAAWASTR